MSEQDWDLLSSYAGLLSLASLSIYAGSFGSIKAPKKQDAEDSDDEDEDIPDRLSSTDAYLFPILGSVMLLGLYLVVKFLGKEWISWLLGWYFTVAGVGSVWKCSVSVARTYVGIERWKKYPKFKVLILKGPWEVFAFSLRTPTLMLFPLSLLPSVLYATLPGPNKSAVLTDLLALSFSHNALSILKLDSFKTGIILLVGLFVYDIWWVFGTEVMVKVATSLDAPIKILWPKSLSFATTRGFTMLGLGDIVVPGLFIALALRYDLSQSIHKQPTQSFAKPYFTAALTGYVIGLATTMAVMHVYGAAQPALLYLSPACIISFIVTGVVTGDIQNAWSWKDAVEEDESQCDVKNVPAEDAKTQTPISDGAQENAVAAVDTDADAHDDSDKPDGGEGSGSGKKKRSKKKKT